MSPSISLPPILLLYTVLSVKNLPSHPGPVKYSGTIRALDIQAPVELYTNASSACAFDTPPKPIARHTLRCRYILGNLSLYFNLCSASLTLVDVGHIPTPTELHYVRRGARLAFASLVRTPSLVEQPKVGDVSAGEQRVHGSIED